MTVCCTTVCQPALKKVKTALTVSVKGLFAVFNYNLFGLNKVTNVLQ